MNKGAQQTYRIAAKQAIENALGGNAEGVLNKLQEPNTKQALATLFGPDEANRYARAAQYQLEQVGKARRVAGGSVRETPALNVPHTANPAHLATQAKSSIAQGIEKGRKGLSPKEAEAVAALGSRRLESGYAKQTLRRKPTSKGPERSRKAIIRAGAAAGSNLDRSNDQ